MLKACLNGPRTRADHPALPVTPAEVAADARRVRAAGAEAVHVHPKDDTGRDSLDADRVASVVDAVREVVPGTPVGVTTGAWTSTDPDERVAAVGAWTTLPDFASVNWHEDGADAVADTLLRRGVGVEAGLWHAGAVDAWLASPHRYRCLRVLVELQAGDAERDAERLLARIVAGGDVPPLLHGEGGSCWPALRFAARHGFDTRIGLEDTLDLPNGTRAPDNAALVTAAAALLGP